MIGNLRVNILGTLAVLALSAPRAAAASYQLAYGGRFVEANGKPVDGPVDLSIAFFPTVTGGTALGAAPVTIPGVTLVQGLFDVPLELSGSEFQAVFASADAPVYIEVTDVTHGKSYPRQRFSVVPFALKVPVDGASIAYDTDGRLTVAALDAAKVTGLATALGTKADAGATTAALATKADTSHTHTLAGDVTGVVATTTVAKIQGRAVASTNPVLNQVLQWDGAQWAPATVGGVGTPESTSTTSLGTGVAVLKGQTGAALEFRSVTGAAPVTVTNPGGTDHVQVAIGQASSVSDGYLAGSDFLTFTNKQAAITAASTVNAGTVTTAQAVGVELKNAGATHFDELTANGANYVALKAPDTLAADVTFTLPAADAAAGSVLKTDGAGNLGWVAIPSAPVTTVAGRTGAITLTTTDVAEGSNQYYTDARARAAITGSAPISVNGSGVVSLANTAVSAGSYTRATITVDAQGRLTAAANGASVNLASEVTGTLPLANGGTGANLSATGGAGQVLKQASAGGAVTVGTLAASDIPTLTAAKISDFTTATNAAESDPQVGTLTASKWCTANAGTTAIDCTTNAPVLTESDPKVGANTTNYHPKWNGTALVAGLIYDNGSTIGIGTTTPSASASLDVVANGSAEATIRIGNNDASGTLASLGLNLNGSGYNSYVMHNNSGMTTSAYNRPNNMVVRNDGAGVDVVASNATGNLKFWTGGSNERMRIDSAGNVGIGTASPASPLDVVTTFTGVSGTQYGSNILSVYNPTATDAATNAALLVTAKTASANTQNGAGLYGGFDNADHYGSGTLTSAYGTYGRASNRGAGIVANAHGVTSMIKQLSTGSITNAAGFYAESPLNSGGGSIGTYYGLYIENPGSVATTSYSLYSAGGTNYLAGNLGIGTTTPTRKLHIYDTSVAADTALSIQNAGAAFTLASLLELKTATKTFHLGVGGTGRSDGLQDKFYILDGAGGTRLVLDGTGSVGIGTNTPGAKLDVNGQIQGGGTSAAWSAKRTAAASDTSGFSAIPGMTVTFTLTRAATVQLQASGLVRNPNSAANCGAGFGFVIDSTNRGDATWGQTIVSTDPNTAWTNWSLTDSLTLSAGSHTAKVYTHETNTGCYACGESDGSAAAYTTCTMNVQAFYN